MQKNELNKLQPLETSKCCVAVYSVTIIMNMPDDLSDDTNGGAQQALQIAFQTMQERCQQLQKRLATVEDENMTLRVEQKVNRELDALMNENGHDEKSAAHDLQKKVEELSKQKSQLTHHVFMVAEENRQLWNRLTRLTRTNKNLGNQLIKISDTLKQHPKTQPLDALTQSFKSVASDPALSHCNKSEMMQSTDTGNKEPSLEEISLRLINSIMTEKSELEQQCTEMLEMQNGADINLQTVGFTYPEETNTDSLQQLKQHDNRLSQTKDALLNQQVRLKRAIRNLEKMKGNACKNCRKNANKTTCQIGTQFDSDDSLREHGATQTSLPPSTSPVPENGVSETPSTYENCGTTGQKVCPLCGNSFGKSSTFESFHEHVVSHFTKDRSLENFEVVH